MMWRVGLFFSSRRRHTRYWRDWSSDVCSSDLKSDQNIEVTTNSINQQNADLINMLVNIYVDNAKTYDSIASLYPEAISNIKKRKIDYIASSSVQTSKGMSSADYYAISMFTMITFYSIMSAMNLVLSDRQQGVASRIYLTGVSNSAILLGKLIGGMLATAVQLTLLYVFTRFVLRVNWGTNDWQIIGVTASLVYLSVAIGIGLATGIRNQSFLTVASNAVIPIFAFLGGSYIPLSTLNSALINQLSNISPIKWVNDSLFYLIFGGQSNPIPVTLMVNLEIGRHTSELQSRQYLVCRLLLEKKKRRVVKFVHSALVDWGSQIWFLGVDLYTAHQAMLLLHPTYKIAEDCHRCSLWDSRSEAHT